MDIDSAEVGIQAKILAYTAFSVTIIFWSQGTDPFNLPKLALLVVGAFSLMGSKFNSLNDIQFKKKYIVEAILTVFVIFGLLASFFLSGAPKWQMIYGVYSRNTGLLCYLSLLIVFLFAANLKNRSELIFVIKYFIFASVVAICVSLIEILGVNIQGIDENINMSLISTFGNSNFISAFLGMTGVVCFTFLIGLRTGLWQKISIFGLIVFSFSLILKSQSKQGLVVLIFGCLLILGFYLLSKSTRVIYKYLYFMVVFIVGILSLAGFTNLGPLATLIYKDSIGYRFEYWKAGIEMFIQRPFSGVGLNSYGDWYRTIRSQSALVSPGPDVITNTAHNVYIDLAATGGIFLIAGFLILIGLALKSAMRVILKDQGFDVLFYALFGAWVVYLLQASISIDQIGLAIWGWVLSGLIIAYEKSSSLGLDIPNEKLKPKGRSAKKVELIPASTVLGIVGGAALAIVILVPPVKSDLSLRKAYGSNSAEVLISVANGWPGDTFKSANIASILLNNRLNAQALEVTKKGLLSNPRSFDLWNFTYSNPVASFEERKEALAKMKALDPRNVNVTSKVISK